MKRTQHQRVAVQLRKIEAAIDFDELGALRDELPAGSPERSVLFSICEDLDSVLRMLRHLGEMQ